MQRRGRAHRSFALVASKAPAVATGIVAAADSFVAFVVVGLIIVELAVLVLPRPLCITLDLALQHCHAFGESCLALGVHRKPQFVLRQPLRILRP